MTAVCVCLYLTLHFLLCSAGLAEFRMGCAERGRSILEGLLANYPKRTDIWSVYIDQVGALTVAAAVVLADASA
jgi:hypothetical protein